MESKPLKSKKIIHKSFLKSLAIKLLWLDNLPYYNTVGATTNCVSFFWM